MEPNEHNNAYREEEVSRFFKSNEIVMLVGTKVPALVFRLVNLRWRHPPTPEAKGERVLVRGACYGSDGARESFTRAVCEEFFEFSGNPEKSG